MRPRRIVAWIAGSLLALFAVAAMLLLIGVTIDVSFLKPRLTAWISAQTDLQIAVRGPLRLTVAFAPALSAEQVTLYAVGEEAGEPLVELDAVALQLEPRAGAPTRMNLRVEHPAAWLSAAGKLEQLTAQGPLDFHLALTSKAPDATKPFRITGRLQDHERGYRLSEVAAHIGATEVSGEALLNTDGPRPLLTVALDIPRLHLDAATARDAPQPAAVAPPAAHPQPPPAVTSVLAALDAVDIDATLDIGRIEDATVDVADISLAVTVRDGQVTDVPFTLVYNTLPVTGHAQCDLRPLLTPANGQAKGTAPFAAELEVNGTTASIRGALAIPLDDEKFELDVAIRGESLQQLSPLLQTPLPALGPYTMRSRVAIAPQYLHLSDISAQVKNSDIGGALELNVSGARPQVSAKLSAQQFNIEDFLSDVTTEDEPIDIRALGGVDANVTVHVQRLQAAGRNLRNVQLDLELIEGGIRNAPFALEMSGAQIAGKASLDARGKIPAVHVKLDATRIDPARLLGPSFLPKNISASIDSAQLELSGAGTSMATLLDHSTTSVTLRKALIEANDPALPRPLSIAVRRADFTSAPGRPFRLSSHGRVNGLPAKLTLAGTRPRRLSLPLPPIPASMRLDLADANLSVTGKAVLESKDGPQEFVVTFSGGRLDNLAPLLGEEIPPLGPYGFKGTVKLSKQRLAVPRAYLRIGSSLIDLDLILDNAGQRPMIQVQLNGERILLDDLMKIRATPQITSDAPSTAPDKSAPPIDSEKDGGRMRKLVGLLDDLSLNTLRKFDADLAVSVDELDTEEGMMQDIDVRARVDAGRLELQPLAATLPGGRIDMRLMVDEDPDAIEVDLGIEIERFDYGPLMRRLAPQYASDGWLGADVALRSRAASYGTLLDSASGHINLAIWPQGVGTAFFDFWGTGLVTDIFTRFLPGTNPTLNCVVGYFDLNEGIATSRAFVMDDTRLTVRGDGTINLREGTIDMLLTPTPKDLTIISIQSPQHLSGSLREPSRRSARGVPVDAVDTAVRVPVNVITFPFRLMLREPIPRDGQVTCASPASD
ncbi:MAG: AsmA family protein [Pseudomonadota bacterium]|nr:MAG: AsmA family protein [Pseudomonadota bacterium]